MVTGRVEIIASELEILNASLPMPFQLDEHTSVGEETRLKYRFLDLRRSDMQENLRLRSRVSGSLRNFLNAQEFIEIETPLLTKATSEGARDYLVPSRTFPGSFFALPQLLNYLSKLSWLQDLRSITSLLSVLEMRT